MEKNKKKRKKSLKNFIKHKTLRKRNIFSILCIILSIIFISFLSYINILPIKYILLISLLILGIDVIAIILINVHKKVYLKVIGSIIIILSLIGSCVGLYYLSNTNNFINKSFNQNNIYNKNTYYVLALKSNHLKEIDISGEIGTYKETVNLTEALKQLNNKYSIKEKT